jgi:hypothetical protein
MATQNCEKKNGAMNGKPDSALLARLVSRAFRYFRENEDAVRAL